MKTLRYFGIALSVGGLLVFCLALVRDPDAVLAAASRPSFGYALLVSTVVIFVSLLLSTLNWHILLSVFDRDKPLGLVGSIFLVTQIGKYLPGNVGHLIGRAATLKSYEVSIGASSKAMLIEVVVLLMTGMAIVIAFLAGWLLAIFDGIAHSGYVAVVVSAVVIVGFVVGSVAGRFQARLRRFFWQLWIDLIASRKRLAVVALIDIVNFALNGLALFFSSRLLFPEIPTGFIACLGIAAASFLAGYVTPGAPGGIGVREATTILLIGPKIGAGEAALVALAVRLAATIADLIGFAVGAAMLQRRKNSRG